MRIGKLLIANRGEIACRIIRTAQALGIETVLAASEADLDSLPAREADEVICIGPAASSQSYLKVEAVVEAAQKSKADAVHPGYGFLSENPALGEALKQAGIIFIGPGGEQLKALGDKLSARKHALQAGLPVVPGAEVSDLAQARQAAAEIDYPILIKAVSGGGGRGMKLVTQAEALEESINLAMAEAEASFGDPRIYMERYVAAGRHVEVQVLGDGEHVIHLGERDCSIQRRYQKLVEEAPAPVLDAGLREAMLNDGVKFARHLNYQGAGTVEFLVDCERQAYYFLEMNARIQVEHPVTEMITGLDLVEEQILIAEGRPLRYRQQDIRLQGHAIECRINAEDIANDFHPSPGTVTQARFPLGSGIRVDTHVEAGATVPPYYDSLLAKLICYGEDRQQAVAQMRRALNRLSLKGVKINSLMHERIMADAEFGEGGVTTAFFPGFLKREAFNESGGDHG